MNEDDEREPIFTNITEQITEEFPSCSTHTSEITSYTIMDHKVEKVKKNIFRCPIPLQRHVSAEDDLTTKENMIEANDFDSDDSMGDPDYETEVNSVSNDENSEEESEKHSKKKENRIRKNGKET